MPDKNKLEVFTKTNMTLFKGCVLCKHGEIPKNTTWGYCKHSDHFYNHAKHGRLPGASHASMGCNDFKMKHITHRDMIELGPYLELVPLHDAAVKEVGVEQEPETAVDTLRRVFAELQKMEGLDIPNDVLAAMKRLTGDDKPGNGKAAEKTGNGGATRFDDKSGGPPVEMHFNGSPKPGEKPSSQPEGAKSTGIFPAPPKEGSSTKFVGMRPTPSENKTEASLSSSEKHSRSTTSASRSKQTTSRSKKSKASSQPDTTPTPEQMAREEAAGHALSCKFNAPAKSESTSQKTSS